MTTPDHPLPQEGGSYIRAKDGSLVQVAAEPAETSPENVAEVSATPTVKGASKPPVKEA